MCDFSEEIATALRIPSTYHETVLDSLSEGIFSVDKDCYLRSINRMTEEITGIPRQNAIGRVCREVFKADACTAGCPLRKTLKTGSSIQNARFNIVRADGRHIPVMVSTDLLKDPKGNVIGGVQTFQDLTVMHKPNQKVPMRNVFDCIVGKSRKMLDLFSMLSPFAESDRTILLEGATGTGKDLFARAVHHSSLRKDKPFVAVNCGALPETLFESELFGYKAGAFTDAKKDKPGLLAQADDGTIFLDEIGDISPACQSKLLRVLEQRIYAPLGSVKQVTTSARFIAATNRGLHQLVEAGKFREDLYYRLNVISIIVPTLKERKEDIPLLVDAFIQDLNHADGKQVGGMSREAMAVLMLHDWPGNVRELKNTVEYAFTLCQGGLIQSNNLPLYLSSESRLERVPSGLTLEEAEKRTIQAALQRNHWKKVATARELGIDKNTLRRKIKRLGISSMP